MRIRFRATTGEVPAVDILQVAAGGRSRLRDLRQFFFVFEKYFLKVPGSSSYYGSYGWWGSSEHTVSNSIDIAIMIFLMIISGYNVYGIDIDTSLSISVMFTQLLTPGGLHR